MSIGIAHLTFRVLHSSSAFLTSLPGAYRIFISYSRVVRPLLIFDVDLLGHFWRHLRESVDPWCNLRGVLRCAFLLGLEPLCSSVGSSEFLFYYCPYGGLLCSSVEFTSFHSLFTLLFHSSAHFLCTRELYRRGAYL